MIKINTGLKIELAPESSRMMSYDEAMLYCFIFEIDGEIGWRMPTLDEYLGSEAMGWHVDDKLRYSNDLYHVTPVRDITYD